MKPPLEVWLDLRHQFGPTRPRWGVQTPIWLRTAGLQLGLVPGTLTEWWQTQCGDWVARLTVEVLVDGESVEIALLAPAAAVTPRDIE